ncbi:MAG: hypothetical protein ACRCVJ_18515 [Clostridium sp.]|uniref:hypothetical protein n=1 Tax=Clostridium sp. TaxID=1506 RepID=UPI003F3CB2C5
MMRSSKQEVHTDTNVLVACNNGSMIEFTADIIENMTTKEESNSTEISMNLNDMKAGLTW